MTLVLVEFLRARLAEDAERQENPSTAWHSPGCDALPDVLYPDREPGACDCGVPKRLLAEVEAKQALLKEHTPQDDGSGVLEACSVCADRAEGEWAHYPAPAPCRTLRLLALPHTGHEAYDEGWRP